MFPGAHIEHSRGSIQQNVAYCQKEGNFETYNPDFFPEEPPSIKGSSWNDAMLAIRESIENIADSFMYLLSNTNDDVLDEANTALMYLVGLSSSSEESIESFHDNFMNSVDEY